MSGYRTVRIRRVNSPMKYIVFALVNFIYHMNMKKLFKTVLGFLFMLSLVIFLKSFISKANTGEELEKYKYYTRVEVSRGDTLWDLADDYIDYSYYKNKKAYLHEIQHINHLDDDFTVYAGQTLVVPYYSEKFILD